jgi:hypothetical protein
MIGICVIHRCGLIVLLFNLEDLSCLKPRVKKEEALALFIGFAESFQLCSSTITRDAAVEAPCYSRSLAAQAPRNYRSSSAQSPHHMMAVSTHTYTA